MSEQEEEKLHLGYRYGFIGNPKGFVRDGVANYIDTDAKKEIHTPYLHGLWIVRADEVEYAGEKGSGYIALDGGGNKFVLVGDEEYFAAEMHGGVAHFMPQRQGAKLREIIFRDSEV